MCPHRLLYFGILHRLWHSVIPAAARRNGGATVLCLDSLASANAAASTSSVIVTDWATRNGASAADVVDLIDMRPGNNARAAHQTFLLGSEATAIRMRLSRVQFNTPFGPPVDRRFSVVIHHSLERGVISSHCSTAAGVSLNSTTSTNQSDLQSPVVGQAINFAAPSACADYYYRDCFGVSSSVSHVPAMATSLHGVINYCMDITALNRNPRQRARNRVNGFK